MTPFFFSSLLEPTRSLFIRIETVSVVSVARVLILCGVLQVVLVLYHGVKRVVLNLSVTDVFCCRLCVLCVRILRYGNME